MMCTLKEVSRISGRHYSKVYRLYRKGLIPARKLGNEVLVDVNRTKALLEALDPKPEAK